MINFDNFGQVYVPCKKLVYFKFYDNIAVDISVGKDLSIPSSLNLVFNSYDLLSLKISDKNSGKVLSCKECFDLTNNFNLDNKFISLNLSNDQLLAVLLSPENIEDIIDYLSKSITKNVEIKQQPCHKCKLDDKWNSLSKDGNWYCYKHCRE